MQAWVPRICWESLIAPFRLAGELKMAFSVPLVSIAGVSLGILSAPFGEKMASDCFCFDQRWQNDFVLFVMV